MIHERGYWTDLALSGTHVCDTGLCNAIIEIFKVESAVDIGCGNGEYTRRLRKAGIGCVGYDGSPLTPEVSNGLCNVMDFSQPQDIGTFDLVLCLEVGEHIPFHYEEIFLDNICNAAKKYITLSWAVEGQAGGGHVNCHNNDYVINIMKERGFKYLEEHSLYLRNCSGIGSCKEYWWFKDTVMVFEKC